jgi:phosphoribosylanthranilate isomerase
LHGDHRWHPRVSRHHKHQLRQGATCAYSGSNAATTLIKICGVTSAEDAELAAAAGAHFIGMIMWPKAKRAVAPAVALAIAAVARRHGAQAVGVFVDEDARTIAERCREAGIGVAQLHGDAAREAVARLPESVQVIYVMHADSDGVIQTMQPAQLAASLGQDLSR